MMVKHNLHKTREKVCINKTSEKNSIGMFLDHPKFRVEDNEHNRKLVFLSICVLCSDVSSSSIVLLLVMVTILTQTEVCIQFSLSMFFLHFLCWTDKNLTILDELQQFDGISNSFYTNFVPMCMYTLGKMEFMVAYIPYQGNPKIFIYIFKK